MFNLFKKKAPEPEKEAAPSPNRQLVEKYGPFAEETVELSAVTGSIGFGVLPQDAEGNPDGPWAAVLPLTAWYEDDEPVTQGKARLVAVADRRLLAHLQRMAPRDSISQVKARPSQQENTYLMTDLPSRFMDPELKAILLEQVKPVTIELEALGEFTYDRTGGLFRGSVSWLDSEIQLALTADNEEALRAMVPAAQSLLERAAEWNRLALDAALSQWEEDGDPILSAIDLNPDGTFAFWLGDDNDPEAICLQGSLTEGFFPMEE